MWDPELAHFWSQGYNLNNFGRNQLDEGVCQISKALAAWFQKIFKGFPYISLHVCTTSGPQGYNLNTLDRGPLDEAVC